METAKENEKKNTQKTLKVYDLPSGKKFTKVDFKGKHVRQAQRLMDGDQSKYMFAIISVACLIDGKAVTMEEMDELDGKDVLKLIAEFEGLFV